MPEISRFFGIVITMYYSDHAPPHFHARHGVEEITVGLDDGRVEGRFSKLGLRLVRAWYRRHRSELLDNWQRARDRRPLKPIKPLE